MHKITGFPAKNCASTAVCLKEGMPADVTVFDADKIDDLVSKKLPDMVDAQEVKRHPPGMKAVARQRRTRWWKTARCHDVFPGKVRRQQLCISTKVPQSDHRRHRVLTLTLSRREREG